MICNAMDGVFRQQRWWGVVLITALLSVVALFASCSPVASVDPYLAEEKRAIAARCERYGRFAQQEQFSLVCLHRADEFGYQMPSQEVMQERAVLLNPREAAAVRECMQYLASYDGLEPTMPVAWSFTQGGYVLICGRQIALTIGANGENKLVGLTNPPLWKGVVNALEGALKESRKKLGDK